MDAGLENTIAAETVLSKVDGQAGRLVIRGHDVDHLAATARFEEIVHLLWSGFFEELPDVDTLERDLGDARLAAFRRIEPALPLLNGKPPIEGVRTALSLMPDGDGLETALIALAGIGVATALVARSDSDDVPATSPNANLPHAEDILIMMTGSAASADIIGGLDAYLVTVAEHGLNASTFVARAVASTQAGLVSAAIGGLSALKGPLHGGAPGPVLDMLDAIGDTEQAEAWIRAALDRGDRLMGFGHRIYRVRDPRADALKQAVRRLPTSSGRLAMAEAIETEILVRLAEEKPDRKLETNVEYYTALLLEALGVPRSVFTCVFATARAAGWIAHAREQLATRRIVRPKSRYIGPLPETVG